MWGVTSGDWASRPYPQIPPKSLFFQHDLHGYPRILCFRQFARPCSFLLCAFLARMGCSTSIVSMSVPSLFQALSYSRLTSGATSVVSKAPLADRGHSFWQGLLCDVRVFVPALSLSCSQEPFPHARKAPCNAFCDLQESGRFPLRISGISKPVPGVQRETNGFLSLADYLQKPFPDVPCRSCQIHCDKAHLVPLQRNIFINGLSD